MRSGSRPFAPPLFALCMALMACGGGESAPSPAADGPPLRNALLISIDTLRPDHLETYGYEREVSPFLHSLDSRAVVFEQAISQAPWTLPSHAAMLASDYPTALGTGTFGTPDPIADDAITLAMVLGAAGFRTGAVVNGGFVAGSFGFSRGFDSYQEKSQPVDASLRQLLAWLEQTDADTPFFAFFHTYHVHNYLQPPASSAHLVHPYDGSLLPERLPEGVSLLRLLQGANKRQAARDFDAADRRYVVDLYDAGIHSLDRQLRVFFDGLAQRGLLEETLVVITSDHGEELFERGLTGHGYSLHDENLRVPLILLHRALPPMRILQQVRTIDLAPTIVDLLGVDAPERWVGESLLPLLRGESSTDRIAFSEHTHAPMRYSLRQPDGKLVQNAETGAEHYFDLRRDPGELRDLVEDATSSDRVAGARDELNSWRRATRVRAAVKRKVFSLDPALARQLESLGYTEGPAAVEADDGR